MKAAGRPEGDELFKNIIFPPKLEAASQPEATIEAAADAGPAAEPEIGAPSSLLEV